VLPPLMMMLMVVIVVVVSMDTPFSELRGVPIMIMIVGVGMITTTSGLLP